MKSGERIAPLNFAHDVSRGQFAVFAIQAPDGSHTLTFSVDDGTVSVATTRLAGARDFRLVSARHTFIMNNPKVLEFTARFIQKGHFESELKRQPILDDGKP